MSGTPQLIDSKTTVRPEAWRLGFNGTTTRSGSLLPLRLGGGAGGIATGPARPSVQVQCGSRRCLPAAVDGDCDIRELSRIKEICAGLSGRIVSADLRRGRG